jgi:hypothetical protein
MLRRHSSQIPRAHVTGGSTRQIHAKMPPFDRRKPGFRCLRWISPTWPGLERLGWWPPRAERRHADHGSSESTGLHQFHEPPLIFSEIPSLPVHESVNIARPDVFPTIFSDRSRYERDSAPLKDEHLVILFSPDGHPTDSAFVRDKVSRAIKAIKGRVEVDRKPIEK